MSTIRPISAAHTAGTSFHDTVIVATPAELTAALGTPTFGDNDGQDKVNMEWCLQLDGKPFTIYDWKEYKPLNMNNEYEWHIGGHNRTVTENALAALIKMLDK